MQLVLAAPACRIPMLRKAAVLESGSSTFSGVAKVLEACYQTV